MCQTPDLFCHFKPNLLTISWPSSFGFQLDSKGIIKEKCHLHLLANNLSSPNWAAAESAALLGISTDIHLCPHPGPSCIFSGTCSRDGAWEPNACSEICSDLPLLANECLGPGPTLSWTLLTLRYWTFRGVLSQQVSCATSPEPDLQFVAEMLCSH